jgi:hypothetical protein
MRNRIQISRSASELFVAKLILMVKVLVIMDPNYWGLICVPLGILVCFGPVLFAAAFGKSETVETDKRDKH